MPDSTNPTFDSITDNLSTPKREALTALIAGSNITDAAQIAGVHRTTLHRWITSDPDFAAAYNAWQHECRESTKVKLLGTVNDALASVTTAIKEGDRRMAYRLIKDLGVLHKVIPGLTDPEMLRQQMESDQNAFKQSLNPTPSEPNPAT
jgi:hypothetical protein